MTAPAREDPGRPRRLQGGGGWGALLALNARVMARAVAGRWIGPDEIAASYDRAAPDYDGQWRERTARVTEGLVARLPDLPAGDMVDLGCGTGGATALLAGRFPGRGLVGVDLSSGMLAVARERLPEIPVRWEQADMLDFLAAARPGGLAMVFSAWAVGYSRPGRLVRAAARALGGGGVLAMVVNRSDTLGPVFRAFRETMLRFPGQVARAAWPRFPSGPREAGKWFAPRWWRDVAIEAGDHPLPLPAAGSPLTPWLLKTGVLAGFDSMLPLARPGPAVDFFDARIAHWCEREPLAHRFLSILARRP